LSINKKRLSYDRRALKDVKCKALQSQAVCLDSGCGAEVVSHMHKREYMFAVSVCIRSQRLPVLANSAGPLTW